MDRDVSQGAGMRPHAGHGLAALGLIMQLGGAIFLVVVASEAAMRIVERYVYVPLHIPYFGRTPAIPMMLGAAVIRSALHILAGRALANGQTRRGLRASYVYIAVALLQTALTLFYVNSLCVFSQASLFVALLLVAWPFTLLVALTRRHVRAAQPVSADAEFEGVAAIMVLLGLAGSLTALFVFYAVVIGGWPWTVSAPMLLSINLCALLMARSILQAMAGLRGARSIDSDGVARGITRYVTFGLVSALLAGVGLVVIWLLARRVPNGEWFGPQVQEIVTIVGLMLSWPLILRRYGKPHAALVPNSARCGGGGHAFDGGLQAIGWLLLTVGLFQLVLCT